MNEITSHEKQDDNVFLAVSHQNVNSLNVWSSLGTSSLPQK